MFFDKSILPEGHMHCNSLAELRIQVPPFLHTFTSEVNAGAGLEQFLPERYLNLLTLKV